MAYRDTVAVDAVLSEDVAGVLESLGLRQDFEEGKSQCCACGRVVDYTNLKLFFPKEDRSVGFLCNEPECFLKFGLEE